MSQYKQSMKYNVSEVTEVIQNRRSIKPEKFTARKVHKEIISSILTNALWAPTHGMTQPWRFKVFTGEGLTQLGTFMAELYKSSTTPEQFLQAKYDKYLKRMDATSVAIAICMERQESEKIPEVEEIAAVACAVQNMHLSATAYGLGGYWSTGGGVYTDEMKGFLKLGAADRCLGLFFLGYPAEEWPQSHRRPLEYMVEWIEE